jgi:hypothetical protein
MTIDRIWVSTTHSPEAMIAASRRGEATGTELDPWPGVVVILARERDLATDLCQGIWQAGAAWAYADGPGDSFRGYSKRGLYSVRVEGHGQRPEFLRDFGAHLHRDAIGRQLEMVRATERQTFITTMNPAALDLLELTTAEQWRRGFIFADADGARHMDPEAAQECARSWGSGVLPVHEILRFGGLW